ncbi:hypothetical protein BDN70DRAFT_829760 [Pholiota conissans]|uniref:Ribonuclease H2 subunit B n=1 Tax=Pholiota conissans TaxID=109636 RepID=A0A9P5Z8X4_9AGAR|nr:hypothetical protein BDN70DRAFT_829760 [Pholiota conissans]
MNSHFCILPTDIIQFLSLSLQRVPCLEDREQPLRVLRLPHPRTGLPALFLHTEQLLPTSENAPPILEIQAVSPPDKRSWIMGEEVMADGKMLVMTPIDPSFLLLPILQSIQPSDGATTQFRTADDLFDEAARKLQTPNETEEDLSISSQDILRFCSLACISKSLYSICEVKEISTEIIVYRYSSTKILEYMRSKVTRLSTSLALEASPTMVRSLAKDGLMDDGQDELLICEFSLLSCSALLTSHLAGRIRVSCDLVSQYLPSYLRDALIKTYDFDKLQKLLDANRDEAIFNAVASAPQKGQTKLNSVADKKRKAAKPSVGVEKLKKANTTGMAKLSNFFNKA